MTANERIPICFLGTPNFSQKCLQYLLNQPELEVRIVITQPDKPTGRGLKIQASPVKALALEKGIKVYTPEKVRDIISIISESGCLAAVVVAYGKILPQIFLDLFPAGVVNIHTSLLPRWRGAAPIQRAIEAGDTQTGVCLQKVVYELDAGDIIGLRQLELSENIHATEVHDQLLELSEQLFKHELIKFLNNQIIPTPQNPENVTYAKKLEKSEELIDWSSPGKKIHNKIRAFCLGPGTYTFMNGKKLKIWKSKWHNRTILTEPGKLIEPTSEGVLVSVHGGTLELLIAQPESKSKISGRSLWGQCTALGI